MSTKREADGRVATDKKFVSNADVHRNYGAIRRYVESKFVFPVLVHIEPV